MPHPEVIMGLYLLSNVNNVTKFTVSSLSSSHDVDSGMAVSRISEYYDGNFDILTTA